MSYRNIKDRIDDFLAEVVSPVAETMKNRKIMTATKEKNMTQQIPRPMHPSNRPTLENLTELFTYHAPTEVDKLAYDKINKAAQEFARVVLETCPECADRSAAIRLVREARMVANASIACAPKEEP